MAWTLEADERRLLERLHIPHTEIVGFAKAGDEAGRGDAAGRGEHTAPIKSALSAQKTLVGRLQQAMDGERARGIAGHWSFDANRCIGLQQAHTRACTRLRMLTALHRSVCP